MPFPLVGLVALVAIISSILGSIVVYLDAQRRNKERKLLWTGSTGLGFIFGVLPGLVVISVYFVVSRKF